MACILLSMGPFGLLFQLDEKTGFKSTRAFQSRKLPSVLRNQDQSEDLSLLGFPMSHPCMDPLFVVGVCLSTVLCALAHHGGF